VKDDSSIYPSEHKVNLGDSVTFSCNSYGENIWYFSSTAEEPLSHLPILKLVRVRSNHSGKYYCYGLGSSKPFVAEAVLKVYGKYSVM